MPTPKSKTKITAILGKVGLVILILITWNWFEAATTKPVHRNIGHEKPIDWSTLDKLNRVGTGQKDRSKSGFY